VAAQRPRALQRVLHARLLARARFVSGVNITSNPKYQTLWDTLYAYGADVVINGHKHSYERLAPQNAAAVRDTIYGIRSFIVGTGGTGLDGGSPPPVANSEVRNTNTWGVLKLTLNSGSYTWQFVPVAGQTFADAGSGLCHAAPLGRCFQNTGLRLQGGWLGSKARVRCDAPSLGCKGYGEGPDLSSG